MSSDLDDIGFQLNNFGSLVDNDGNSEDMHAVENGKHPAESLNSKPIEAIYGTTSQWKKKNIHIESGQIFPECMEDHCANYKSNNPYMYDTTKACKKFVYFIILNILT